MSEEVDGHAVEEPVEVRLAAGVAAEEAMLAEEPEVAGLRRRLVGRLGDVVGVGEPVLRLGRCERREHRRERLGVDADTSASSSRSFASSVVAIAASGSRMARTSRSSSSERST